MPLAAEWPPVVPSITDLPISDPRCSNESCAAFYAALNARQTATPYSTLGSHAHWMVYYLVAVIGVFSLAHAHQVFRDRLDHLRNCQNRPSLPQKVLAVRLVQLYQRSSAEMARASSKRHTDPSARSAHMRNDLGICSQTVL